MKKDYFKSYFVIFASTVFVVSLSALARTAEEVKEKTADAANAAVEYSKEKKESFSQDMEKKLASIRARINELGTQADQASKEKIDRLKVEQKSIEADLQRLNKSTGKAWSQMKVGISKAWNELEQSFAEARKEIKGTP